MSLSKLESLPNEILSDIIEKYINGVDVLMAFSFQLNRRFDALIVQCPKLYFNFIQCQKDDFRFCMGLLPAYIDKIEELAISEQDTPGQVYAFLCFFASFVPFTRLRKLDFHYNSETVPRTMVTEALLSLSDTTIDTLSLNITHEEDGSLSNYYFVQLLQLETLKRFRFGCKSGYIDWNLLTGTSSTVEYLTISVVRCKLSNLRTICQLAPRLKYLDVGRFEDKNSSAFQSEQSSEKSIVPMRALRTLILSFEENDQITLDMLAPYLKAMPVLNRLEIKGNGRLVDAEAWEMLLETSLPLLTHLTLRTTISRLKDADIDHMRRSFQNSFWIAKKNFNVIITNHIGVDINMLDRYFGQNFGQYDFNLPAAVCLIAPNRTVNDGFTYVDGVLSLRLSDTSGIELCHYYLNNVKCLTVDDTNRSLFEWMTTFINCSGITEVFVTQLYEKTDEFASLLACVPNMNSLHIRLELLLGNKRAFVENNICLKRLDISADEHIFDKKAITLIAGLFPYLEHIQINTKNLHNVPILKMFLSHLRSLTFYIADNRFDLYDRYARKRWVNELQEKTKFLFHYEENFITIWIDQATCEEPYWRTFDVNLPQSTATSIMTRIFGSSTTSAATKYPTATASSDDNKKKKGKFSLKKFFKK